VAVEMQRIMHPLKFRTIVRLNRC